MSVEFYDGVEVIKKQAFQDCRSLRKILIPPSVRAIKDWAFSGCKELTTVILGNELEEIGEHVATSYPKREQFTH